MTDSLPLCGAFAWWRDCAVAGSIGFMFEMFSDRARRVVVLAQEEARELHHGHVGTEHLLLGLSAQGNGMAAEVLGSLPVTLDVVRARVAESVTSVEERPSGSIPFTQRAKKVLELAELEARSLGHSEIDTAHLLLGLVREGAGVGAQVCVKLDVDLDQVRLRVLRLLASGASPAATGEGASPSSPEAATIRTQLAEIQDQLRDLGTRLTAIERRLDAG